MNKDQEIKKLEEYVTLLAKDNTKLEDDLSSAVSELIIIGKDCGFHVTFGVKMIVDGHITLEEYCNSMPWVHSHTAARVVNEMKKWIEYRHFNLTQEEIDEAIVSLAERKEREAREYNRSSVSIVESLRKKTTNDADKGQAASSLRKMLATKTKSDFD